ncbi:carboxymuconolactone decarboxylase family protein [Nonlabens sp.]|uniref:carboxymuconolactone decarboxylase family protein n=1 Tax=Nonlabens sp. TaxID=1888209 RepID=UPI0025F99589|nr:carboxymuconolactone decarboxylase family protein [Nonlabens sp.]
MKNYIEKYQEVTSQMEQLRVKIPETMNGFTALHKASVANGALLSKTKELISLGIAIAVHCDGCIAFHVHDALKAGATKEDILETIGVAICMGGGPALVYGGEAMQALEQFKASKE